MNPVPTIRREEARDRASVSLVNEIAFGRRGEAELVRALHEAGAVTLSVLAEVDDKVVGHVLFSPVTIDGSITPLASAGLAPLAVLPDYPRKGIGSRLVREGLDELLRLGGEGVVVLGHADYYRRFGFVPASRFGVRCEFDCPDEAFMALELRRGALLGRAGIVRYRPEFANV